jgi:hypothetical protein
MKRMAWIFGILACMGFVYCSTGTSNGQTLDVQNDMELIVEPGTNWLSKMKVFLFFSKNNSPQLAAWIEDDNGNYVSTVAISEKTAKGNWISAPKEGRPEALPVWNNRQQNFSATNDFDAVSSATIKDSFEANIDKGILVDGNTYNVFLEINHSFDYNEHWTKDNSGVNGQPSLIYHAQFIAGQSGNISLAPIGHGSVDGSNGNIARELDNFTSALSIIQNASISVKQP